MTSISFGYEDWDSEQDLLPDRPGGTALSGYLRPAQQEQPTQFREGHRLGGL